MGVNYKTLKNAGFMRQVQKDNFSLRIKVVGGKVTAKQLMVVAKISEKYGKGHVHLTSRQSVEIPFIKLDDIEAVKSELEKGGVFTSACGPQVRTVTACQGNAVCSSGCIDTYPLAQAIAKRYFGRELPHKFKFGVTGCMNNCLKAEENDLGIKGGYTVEWLADACTFCGVCTKACRENALTQTESKIQLNKNKCINCGRCAKACPFDAWKYEQGYLLSFGGTFGNRIASGEQFLPMIKKEETLFRVTDAALAFFDKYAMPGERLRVVIERAGWDNFKKEMELAYDG